MRADRDISKRMRELLTHDKINIREGFSAALAKDLERLMGDYFQLEQPISIDVEQRSDGKYIVNIRAFAVRIKQFDTTYDIKRY